MEKKRKSVWLKIASVFFITVITLVAAGCLYIYFNYETEVDMSMFGTEIVDSTTRFYYLSAAGEEIELDETLKASKNILYCEYEQMPPELVNAFVAIEDKRFFEHNGVDIYRTLGAAANYLFGFDKRFGASTITQQLVKNVSGKNEITVKRKIQEILWAYDLERKMSKEEIMENYLNVINLSQGCYGVGAAANVYFSKKVEDLTLAECATIAAITNSPTYYNPIKNPENNKERRNLILDEMLAQGLIGEIQYAEAYDSDLNLNVNQKAISDITNSWYVDMVVDDVIADLVKTYGYSSETASKMVYNGGLRIVTAMDPKVQGVMEKYYENTSNFKYGGEALAESAMIVINPHNGDVLGVVGAIGKKEGNRIQSFATDSKRPSGSTIKPLSVYAPALENRLINYATVYDDVPLKFSKTATGYKLWPQNATMVYSGLTNVNYALKNSLNTVSLKILNQLGTEKSFDFVKNKLAMKSLIEGERNESGYITDKAPAALGLGQMNYGVTLRELTSAYSMFPNGGQTSKSRSYYTVTDSKGRLLLDNTEEHSYAISKSNSYIMTKMLQNVITTGTAKAITLDNIVEVAGKTGTTQNDCDKWFVAYTPYCLGGIWYGYEYPKPISKVQKNAYLEVWNDIMTELHKKYFIPETGRKYFARDDNVIKVTYCKDSGKLMSNACYLDPRLNRAEVGYFVKGTEPQSYCDCHKIVEYDVDGEGIACKDCDYEGIVNVGLVQVKRSFPMQILVSDAQYVCRDLPDNVPITTDGSAYFSGVLRRNEFCGVSGGKTQFNKGCALHSEEGYSKREEEEKIQDPEME
ncbi:MAG: transglycosylase domain-containing protein [Clostridia bacterium]|nr:transglycosylase domain-containing protein [Clostridia bacterium]